MVNWETKKHHDDFTVSDTYGPFLKRFHSIIDGKPLMFCHVDFKPEGSLNKTFSAPVTEIATFYFEGGPPEDYLQGVEKLGKILDSEKPEGYLNYSAGITYEEIEREGVKGKAAVATIGWQSVEHHMVSLARMRYLAGPDQVLDQAIPLIMCYLQAAHSNRSIFSTELMLLRPLANLVLWYRNSESRSRSKTTYIY